MVSPFGVVRIVECLECCALTSVHCIDMCGSSKVIYGVGNKHSTVSQGLWL